MRNLAIITARGGSKRIPRKNIKNFMGKPMLAYAIEAALESKIFDEIMVSTDDNEISEVAKKCGAKVPFKRSEKNSNDFATTRDVLLEVIEEYQKRGETFDNICCIYPCVPFLKGEDLKSAFVKFRESESDALTPIVRYSFPIQRAFKINKNGYIEFREPEFANARSQDIEPMFHDTGMFYFYNVEKFLKDDCKKRTYIELDESVVQDIDNESDWKIAEIKYKVLNEQ